MTDPINAALDALRYERDYLDKFITSLEAFAANRGTASATPAPAADEEPEEEPTPRRRRHLSWPEIGIEGSEDRDTEPFDPDAMPPRRRRRKKLTKAARRAATPERLKHPPSTSADLAAWREKVIAPILAHPRGSDKRTEAINEITGTETPGPDGQPRRISKASIYLWLQQAEGRVGSGHKGERD